MKKSFALSNENASDQLLDRFQKIYLVGPLPHIAQNSSRRRTRRATNLTVFYPLFLLILSCYRVSVGTLSENNPNKAFKIWFQGKYLTQMTPYISFSLSARNIFHFFKPFFQTIIFFFVNYTFACFFVWKKGYGASKLQKICL